MMLFSSFKNFSKLHMMAPTCNPSTQEAEARGFRIELDSKTLSQKSKAKQKSTFPINKDNINTYLTDLL